MYQVPHHPVNNFGLLLPPHTFQKIVLIPEAIFIVFVGSISGSALWAAGISGGFLIVNSVVTFFLNLLAIGRMKEHEEVKPPSVEAEEDLPVPPPPYVPPHEG